MVVKIYVSGISGNKEVKKRQQRVLMILDSKNVEYETIDITEPGKELDKEFMQGHSVGKDSKYPLPPQIFNEDEYCGDYEDFDMANELDELEKFLKMTPPVSPEDISQDSNAQNNDIQENGNTSSREPSTDKDAATVKSESAEDRTNLPNDNDPLDESKATELDGGTKENEEDVEQMEEPGDKNEEKSDDQEKEE
ncbi:PREDICTED: SH3 domain-binding glutamic acid-rich protein homolog [Polistes dominula]|uniref:SH3 domain-binding glutamic acid-rich protein homolog n=1 Tax=Polistes dominula TaxID=743375 RepID=A0ABM1I0Q3_POLDO|nr:PREDICTED: SH3 domain-binding glutamic acid-rich protein homolog [Polistes dominula]XP_015173789.1 PREDICTED: SH3 domain-binding glutamic acid-rich protein homolog [Polistes dominula]XP_015173790.1 PREDICTED: SH3 domain-binding glutamic acid-rich protein homolog [Polistes dominula]XP_015173791.1 PREDICTED: SH3 domain-binding glutamic acid-rich protein homolog [Polistes dominula]